MPQQHICGTCAVPFATEEDYLGHICAASTFTPADIEHLEATTTPNIAEVAAEAQARGEERKAG